MSNFIKNLALIIFSTIIALLFAEFAYRLYLRKKLNGSNAITTSSENYLMCPTVHINYDAKYGEQPKPNNACWVTAVNNGSFVGCFKVFEANSDGLDGKTTIADYKKANKKILVFGDSFTHWDFGDSTWPDYLQQQLNTDPKQSFAVLNYGRGAYGVLQMLDLAADKVSEMHPDLVVIAAIYDDFSRARWWGKEVNNRGMTRWLISTDKDNFSDMKNVNDFMLVVPEATPEWAYKQAQHSNHNDPVLKKANSQYNLLKNENDSINKQVPLLRWDHSFLYAAIKNHDAFNENKSFFGLPRISITNYNDDARAVEDIRKIKASGVPVVFMFLPTMNEIQTHTITDEPNKGQNQQLINSLQQLSGTQIHLMQNEYKGPVPPKIDLLPADMHPSKEGLQLYSEMAYQLVKPYFVNR